MSVQNILIISGISISIFMLALSGAFFMGRLSEHMSNISNRLESHILEGASYRKEVGSRFDRLESKLDELISRISK